MFKFVVLCVVLGIFFASTLGCECPNDAPIKIREKSTDPENPKVLNVKWTCKDRNNKIIHTCETTEENPFDSGVHVHTFSYRGSFSSGGVNPASIDHKEKVDINNEVESFER